MAYDVLIVDDSRTSRGILKRILKMTSLPWGEILEANNGETALALLKQRNVDLVLADLNMPVMDGPAMIHALRADPQLKGTPVLVVSAEGDPEVIADLRREGVLGVLRKPLNPPQMKKAVEEALSVGSRGNA